MASFREQRAALLADGELKGRAFCCAYASLVDSWLVRLLGDEDDVALIAVGGYGRGELCPGSDIDVVLVHSGRYNGRCSLNQLAQELWYPLWDAGLKLGHAVRTPKEALALASTDLDTATALLQARLVTARSGRATEMAAQLAERAQAQWRKRSKRWLVDLAHSVAERHRQAGEVAFLLEPNLKEGRGGLRDVHALHWAEAAQCILLPGDDETTAAAYDALLAARVELHRRTGKASDRLSLQEQDSVAAALGDANADVLMARLAAAARTIAWTSDEAWERIASSLRGPKGRVASTDHEVARGVVLREDTVELAPDANPAGDPALVLRAAAAAAEAGTRLSRGALERLAAEASEPPVPWPEDLRRHLVALLATGHRAIPVIEALDQKGLLAMLVPEWEAVRSKPQRNAYHRFTVDRHLCEAAAEAARLANRVHRPDLLLIGAWLHDIGKGFTSGPAGQPQADHTHVGIEIVDRIGTRMGFSPDDVKVLVTLVRHHLLLSKVATRRDLTDEATVVGTAKAVGDLTTLELLSALTEADSIATGPVAWSPWRQGLVRNLVARTARLLAGDGHDATPGLAPEYANLLAQARAKGDTMLTTAGNSITVVTRDRPGLFCRVAGTLTLHGLEVLDARADSTDDGWALESFRVQSAFGTDPNWRAVEADLHRVLNGRISLEARVVERTRTYSGRLRILAASPAQTRVTFDNEASKTATVVEVRAPDRIGTLYRITRALAELDLDVRHAKVATLGHEVVDAFYVVDADGTKLTEPGHQAELKQAILVELSRA